METNTITATSTSTATRPGRIPTPAEARAMVAALADEPMRLSDVLAAVNAAGDAARRRGDRSAAAAAGEAADILAAHLRNS